MSHRLAVAAALLFTAGCSSFSVELAAPRPEEAAKSVEAIFVVVGSEKDLAKAETLPDPLELVKLSEREKYVAVLQFEPRSKQGLAWHNVMDNPHSDRVAYSNDAAPLVVKLDSGIAEEAPDTTVVVIAQFVDGSCKCRLLSKEKIATKKKFVVDLRDRELKQR